MKINSNLNKNFNTPKKQTTFGVRKTDRVQSFINEIRTTNQNLGNLERLPIVQKMKESDTFEQLKERANANRSMFENKRSFNIANERGFTTFINSICFKIMDELRQLGETVGKFIVQVEDENGNKKEKDIVRASKVKLYVKASHKKNPEKRKEDNKKYYETHKDESIEYSKQYRKTHKDKILKYQKEYRKLKKQEKKVIEFLNELRNQRNEKPNLLQKIIRYQNNDVIL